MGFANFIFEMAYKQDRAIEKIEDLLPQLSLHILKVWLMPESRDREHWIKEIENWLNLINRFSRVKNSRIISKSKFKKEFGGYFEIDEVEDNLYILRHYKFELKSPKILSKRLKQFFDWLWESISSRTFKISSAIQKIQEEQI